jgi:hypothetical protein
MSRERITEHDVHIQMRRVSRMLNDDLNMGVPTLHLGSNEYKISNKLVLDNRNVWPEGAAGFTKRDAYNALRIMASTLGAVIDHQQDIRAARARTGL